MLYHPGDQFPASPSRREGHSSERTRGRAPFLPAPHLLRLAAGLAPAPRCSRWWQRSSFIPVLMTLTHNSCCVCSMKAEGADGERSGSFASVEMHRASSSDVVRRQAVHVLRPSLPPCYQVFSGNVCDRTARHHLDDQFCTLVT